MFALKTVTFGAMGKYRDLEHLVSWVRSQFMFPQFQLEFLGAIPVPEVRSRNSLFMEDRVRLSRPIRALYWGQLTNQRPSCHPISRPDHAGAQFQMCRRFETHFGFRHWPGLAWADSISLGSRSDENVSSLYKWVIGCGWLATTTEKVKMT